MPVLASMPGSRHDPVTREVPDKIPHEVRSEELPRAGDVPFGPRHGTSDVFAPYVILMRDRARATDAKRP